MRKNYSGFTLVEVLLYLAVAILILATATIFFFTILQSRVKNQTVAEVEAQGSALLHTITQTIRNSSGINSPSQGGSGSSLSIVSSDPAKDPTVFDVQSGVARITEGVSSAVALTNSRVSLSGLTFQNLSRTGTAGTVRVQFTLTHTNSSGRNEYNYTKTFYASGSLR
jgi:Tfp pilus assembly protein PilW